jgi:hypothetical protein
VKIENPVALSFIFDEEVYLLNTDKQYYTTLAEPETSIQENVIESVPSKPVVDFKFWGGNKKNFLVISSYRDEEFINGAHLTALENTLKRRDLLPDDIAIFNISNFSGTTIDELQARFKPQRIMILGKDISVGGLDGLTFNSICNRANCSVLYTFSFDEMMNSNDNKKAFWEQVKQF